MGRRFIYVLAVLAIILYAVQLTPLAFLSKDVADFAGGFALGLTIGAIVAWFTSRSH